MAEGTGGENVRLVDADKQLEWVDCMKPIHGIGLEPVVAVETVRDLIKGAPTIDAIPMDWIDAQIHGYAARLQSTELKALLIVKGLLEKEQEAR